jgi:hypothetical protein
LRSLPGTAILLLAAAIACAPILRQGASCGHDFDFHLVSWMDARQAWQHGLFYPHWSPSSNFGAGEPRFIFYPPLTWMLGALLGLALPWTLVPVVLTFLLLAATGLATRSLARLRLSELPATLAGVLALGSGYALFTAYERTAYGELAGGLWIPLLLFFQLRRRPDGWIASSLPTALVLAACWLCNAPVGVIASYLLLFVAGAQAFLHRSAKPLLPAALASALGLALCAFYLIPAAYEQKWVEIQQATSDAGERIENNFLFMHSTAPLMALHDEVLHSVSVIGTGMLAASFLALLLLFLQKRKAALRNAATPPETAADPAFLTLLALLPLLVLILQLPFSLPLWNLLPKMRFLQFPWRWFLVLEAPMAILLLAALWPNDKQYTESREQRAGQVSSNKDGKRWWGTSTSLRWPHWLLSALCLLWTLAAATWAGQHFYQPCDEEDNPTAMAAAFRSGAGFAGTDEYTSRGADPSLMARELPAACLAATPTAILGIIPPHDPGDFPLPVWSPKQNSCQPIAAGWEGAPEHLRLRAVLPHAGVLVLRLRRYPAWKIQLNGRELKTLPRKDGLTALRAPGGPVEIAADWRTTPDFKAGRGLSLLGVLALTGLWLLTRRRTRPHLS